MIKAKVVVWKDGKVVVPAFKDEGGSVENIILNNSTFYGALFGRNLEVRLHDIEEKVSGPRYLY